VSFFTFYLSEISFLPAADLSFLPDGDNFKDLNAA
jgi:hypothetical protein